MNGAVAADTAGVADVVGLVLAGGVGARFDPSGQRYKLVQPLADGRPVIRAACEALLPWVDTLTVVCGAREPEIRGALAGLPLDILVCPDAQRGMGATLKRGVAATRPRTGWLVALGDMPYLEDETIAALAATLREGALLARPRHQGQAGHPVGFSSALGAELMALDDGQGAMPLLRRRAAEIRWIDVRGPGALRDVDLPEDLAGPRG